MHKWDARFIELAKLIATWSKQNTKVGAVIVDNHQRIIATGFNGCPRGVDDYYVPATREIKLMRILHAEENAILFCKQDVMGMTIYCTHPPCAKCAAQIIQAGIGRVVYPIPDTDFRDRWREDLMQAKLMFDDAQLMITMI